MPRQLINKYGQVEDPDLLQVIKTIKETLSTYTAALAADAVTIPELHTINYVVTRAVEDCISFAIFSKAVDVTMVDLNPNNIYRTL